MLHTHAWQVIQHDLTQGADWLNKAEPGLVSICGAYLRASDDATIKAQIDDAVQNMCVWGKMGGECGRMGGGKGKGVWCSCYP